MKVLMVNNGYPPEVIGGAEIYVKALANELRKRGHEVHIVVPLYKKLSCSRQKVLSAKLDNGLFVHKVVLSESQILRAILKHGIALGLYYNEYAPIAFLEVVKLINPDIVHFHNVSWWRAPAILTIPKRLGIPSLITLHDYWFVCPLSTLYHYRAGPCKGPTPTKCRECWVNSVSSNAISKNLLKKLIHENQFDRRQKIWRETLANVDLIIAPSKFLMKIISSYYPSIKNKIIHLENGYPIEIFDRFQKKSKTTSKIIFGFVGRINKEKGLHVLVDAFMNVPEDKAELRIYGKYNPSLKYTKELLEKTKYKKNITFVGGFKPENVKDPYSEIDVLVFPSMCYENCPLVLLEARATRTPVIASNIGAIPEFIQNGINGLLFTPGDSNDLREKIEFFIKNPELISKFGKNMIPPKSMQNHAIEIEYIYNSLIRRG